MHAYNKNT
jgi:hypothetical protein